MINQLKVIGSVILMLLSATGFGQEKDSIPKNFDAPNQPILHGKIDTVQYHSDVTGVDRHALVYTTPGYSKQRNTPYCICFMVLEGMKENG